MAELVARFGAHVRVPLHRDAYALVANSGFTAATGLLYWIVAAKAFSPHAVGINSALISSMMFLAGVAGLNLANVVVRFLPEAGRQTGRVIALGYAVTGAAAAAIATVFVAGVGTWAPRLDFVASSGPLAVWFVVATVAWTVFVIQDGVLTALGRAVWVPVENAGFSIVKLGLLAGAAALAPRFGIFVSWTLAVSMAVVVVNVLVFRRLARAVAARPARTQLSLRERGLRRYLMADYAGATAWLAAVNLLPVIVTAAAGATTNAYFALAWAVAFPLYTVGANVGTSLVLHGAADRTALPLLVRKALKQGAIVLVPAVVALVLFAPLLLSLFGPAYAHHSAGLLRVLALGTLPNLVLALTVSVARAERRMRGAVVALSAQALLSLGLAVPFLHAFGVIGAGLAWLVGQCAVAAALLVAPNGPWRRDLVSVEELRARLGTALSGGRARSARAARATEAILAGLPEAHPSWDTWAARTDADVAVRFVGPRPDARLVVKVACSPAGAAALAAHRSAMAAVRTVTTLNGFAAALPTVVATGETAGQRWIVERALSGVDGRRLVRTVGREPALAAAARGVAPLYATTGMTRTVDDALLDTLVDARIEPLARVRGDDESLRRLRHDLRSSLEWRTLVLARSHGDLWLGNVLLAPDGSAVTGVVDWEASRPADLPGIDLAHLVISTRSLVDGAPLGTVVRRALAGEERLSPLEAELLAPYADTEGPAVRELLVLAWLQHVAQRLTQTALHSPTRWLRRTVDPVLAELGY